MKSQALSLLAIFLFVPLIGLSLLQRLNRYTSTDPETGLPEVGAVGFREWSDASREFSVEARLVSQDDIVIELEKPNGEVVKVPVGQLSAEDLEYLELAELGLHNRGDVLAAVEKWLSNMVSMGEPESECEEPMPPIVEPPKIPPGMLASPPPKSSFKNVELQGGSLR